MSRRPFNPNELDRPSIDADRVAAELESYSATAASDAPRALQDRVMAAIAMQPAARRSHQMWLLIAPRTGGGLGRFARAGAVAATLVLAIAGALFAGQLADLMRNVGAGSPRPVPSASPTPIPESSSPTPSITPVIGPVASPDGSDGAGESQEASGQPDSSELETPQLAIDENGDGANSAQESSSLGPDSTND